MRILVVGTGAPGGVGRYERLLAAALARLGAGGRYEVRWLLRHAHPQYLTDTGLANARHCGGRLGRLCAAFASEVLWGRPDLVLFTHVNLARLAVPLAPVRLLAPYIVFAYGIEVWGALPAVKRRALLGAAHVVALSRYTHEQLVAVSGVDAARVTTIHPTLEPTFAPPGEVKARDGRTHRLLSVCRLDASERYKGIDAVIRVLPGITERLPGVTYTVVGDGDDRPRLAALAAACGVADRVRLTGAVDHETLLGAYTACDLFVLPSEREGFGLVFLEAMAFGKPIVARAAAGALDVVVHGETGLLVRDEPGLSVALTRLLEDPDEARRMGQAGRRRLADAFAFDTYAARIGETIDRVATCAG